MDKKTESEDLKIFTYGFDRSLKRAESRRRCADSLAEPLTIAYLPLFAELDNLKNLCWELTLSNQCFLELVNDAKAPRENVCIQKRLDAAVKNAKRVVEGKLAQLSMSGWSHWGRQKRWRKHCSSGWSWLRERLRQVKRIHKRDSSTQEDAPA